MSISVLLAATTPVPSPLPLLSVLYVRQVRYARLTVSPPTPLLLTVLLASTAARSGTRRLATKQASVLQATTALKIQHSLSTVLEDTTVTEELPLRSA